MIMSLRVALISGCCAGNLWRVAALSSSARFTTMMILIWYFFGTIATSVLLVTPTLFIPTMHAITFLGLMCGLILSGAVLLWILIQRYNLARAQAIERQVQETPYPHKHTHEQLFRQCFDQSPFGAAVLDANYHFTRTNSALSVMIGSEEIDLVATSLINLIHPDDRIQFTTQIQRLFMRGISHFTVEQRWKQVNGGTIWVQVFARLLSDDSDSTVSVLLQTIDITAQKQLANAIENARLLEKLQTSAVESDQPWLGRNLHDSVSQTLFAAHRVAEILPDLWELDPEEGRAGLREIRRFIQSALAEMRALRRELRPYIHE